MWCTSKGLWGVGWVRGKQELEGYRAALGIDSSQAEYM